jgi:CHAT domain-containing protein
MTTSSLIQVQIRIVGLYHTTVSSLEQHSNFIGEKDKTIFLDSKGDRAFELKCLRQVLQTQGRWRLAPIIMLLELYFSAPGSTLKEAIQDAFQLCALLETHTESPLKFRSAVLKKRLADQLSALEDSLCLNTTKEYIAILEDITGSSYSRWEDFCPVIAFDIKKTEIMTSKALYLEKVDRLLQLIEHAGRRNDFTKANQTYISAHSTAKEWLDTVKEKSEEPSALETLRMVGKDLFEFHDQQTRMAFFKGAALSDYLNTLSVRCHDYSTVMQLVGRFEEKHPNFGIPNILERLYDQALTAARHLGMAEKSKQLTEKYQKWFMECSFVAQGGGGISDEAISDPDFAFREIKGDSNDPVEWGSNAIRLMMRWVGHEWDRGLISVEYCRIVFGPSLGDLPQGNLDEYLKDVPIANITEAIFGTHDEPTTTFMYLARYRKLLEWILIPDRLPSRSARIFALKLFHQSRLYRVRGYLCNRGESSIEEAVAVEEETKALTELENLEAAETGNNMDQEEKERMSAIHTALVKSFAIGGVKSGLIDEAELVSRASDCRALITHYHNSGHRIKEYNTICQLIRLTWQRYLHFNTAPEKVMPLVNEADKVFIETRNAITASDPSENLVARAQLSEDFFHREHHSYALAGRLKAFETYRARAGMAQANNMPHEQSENQNLAWQSFIAFLYWSFRSKGRGFVDILNLETNITQALETSKRVSELDSKFPNETLASGTHICEAARTGLESKLRAANFSPPEFISPLNQTMVTKQQIDEMLQSLPDGVVIVDFLDLKYSPTTSFVAMIYRKGQLNFPTNIPNMSMAKIDKWVNENLAPEQEEQPGQLSDTNALDKLGELHGLLEPLLRPIIPKTAIQPDETIIFCPTGSLNRVPIHAIPVDGRPFIERNPVVYCQSLTILYWLWLKFRNRERTIKVPKTTVVNPMPEFWPDETPVESNETVADLARKLDADFHHGFDLQSKTIAKAVEGSTLFYHHGHVSYNAESAIDSAMVLNEKAFKAARRIPKPKGCEFLTAREFFKIKLCEPALAVIVGCGSGMAAISNTDDVLGIPTALFYAGASSVVSTLWSIDDEDGAQFSKQFYAAVWEQKKRTSNTAAPTAVDESRTIFDCTIDIARAMQTAVMKLRQDAERKELLAPYHWAAFTLNGFWILPDRVVSNIRSSEIDHKERVEPDNSNGQSKYEGVLHGIDV